MQDAHQPGRVFGPYLLAERLRQDDRYAVYRATRRDFEQTVTIRIAVSSDIAPPDAKLHLLDHAGVERVLDQGITEDGLAFVVAEAVQGEAIDRYCDEHRESLPGRVGLLVQALGAVAYAHQHLVAHGRICANNLLVDSKGQLKVCGFGEAGGPPRFGAGGMGPVLADDLASFGELAAYLICGIRPDNTEPAAAASNSERRSLSQALSRLSPAEGLRIAAARSTTPRGLQRGLRGALEAVLLRAATTAHDRSLDLLRSDLQHALCGKQTSAYTATRPERVRLWCRYHPTTAITAGMLAVAAIAASGVFLRQTASLNGQRRQAELRMDALMTLTGALETRLYTAAGGMPQPKPARIALLRQTRQTLDAATADAVLKPQLARTASLQYRELAEHSAEMGDMNAARHDAGRATKVQSQER